MPPSTYSGPVIGTEPAEIGKGGGVNRLRDEEDLPVALMHSTVFRSFFSLLDDGPDMKELRMCWQALQQPVINTLAFSDAG
jgi:hypothetical protein